MALGAAVAKISHDLRNMLTSAQMASERLATSGDPKVAKALPRLERALDRALSLAQNVLNYGRSEEPPPATRRILLLPAVEAAAEDAGLLIFARWWRVFLRIVVRDDLGTHLEVGPMEARVEIGRAGIAIEDFGRHLAVRRVLPCFT